jgi:hypothetical protein
MAELVTNAGDLFEASLQQMLYVELTLSNDVLPRLARAAHSTDRTGRPRRDKASRGGNRERPPLGKSSRGVL